MLEMMVSCKDEGEGSVFYAGQYANKSNSSERVLIEVTPSGSVEWESNLIHSVDIKDLRVGEDGSVYTATTEGMVRKISADGVEQWALNVYQYTIYGIVPSSTGDVYVIAQQGQFKKIKADGSSEEFSVQINYNGNNIKGRSIDIDNSGYLYVYGESSGADYKNVITKLDSSGTQVWQVAFGDGTLTELGGGDKIYVFGGDLYFVYGGIILAKLSTGGGSVTDIVDLRNISNGSAYGLTLDEQGDIYIQETYSYNGNVPKTLKVSPSGSLIWSVDHTEDTHHDIALDGNGNLFSPGRSSAGTSINLLFLDSDTGAITSSQNFTPSGNVSDNYYFMGVDSYQHWRG